jgi:thiopeptide-type bacteriocin biosynthesis protein
MSGRNGARWHSLHLFGMEPPERFLAQALLPWLRQEVAAGRVRRFFFIRYSEGGPHLRLRFMLDAGLDAETVGAELLRLAGAPPGESATGARVESHAYDRGELYFGETRATVYSELLNEATSWLALSLLAPLAGQDMGRRLAAAASTAYLLLERAADRGEELAEAIAEGREFAGRSALQAGLDTRPRVVGGADALAEAVHVALPRLRAGLASHGGLARAAALVRRARRGAASERFAATHGVHLLCNKLGLSLAGEHEAFAALETFHARRTEAVEAPV